MRGVKGSASRLVRVAVVALPLLAGACVADVSDEEAYYLMQQQMGWNAEQQAIIKQKMKELDLALTNLGVDRATRSMFGGLLGIYGQHHHGY